MKMKEEKKLQKKFKKEFETPDVPFEEWAEKRGLFTDNPQTVECPILEPAENVNGRGTGNNLRKRILLICAPILAVFIALAILLGCLLPRPAAPNGPKIYGANDTDRVNIEWQEIANQENIYLFDMSGVNRGSVYKDVLIEDKSQVLLYTLDKCLLSVESGENVDGFYVNYYIRKQIL